MINIVKRNHDDILESEDTYVDNTDIGDVYQNYEIDKQFLDGKLIWYGAWQQWVCHSCKECLIGSKLILHFQTIHKNENWSEKLIFNITNKYPQQWSTTTVIFRNLMNF